MRRLVACLLVLGAAALRPRAPSDPRPAVAPDLPAATCAVLIPEEPRTVPDAVCHANLDAADEVFYPPRLTQEDGDIVERLHSIVVSLEFNDAPLPGVIDYLREITGLNFIIDIVTVPDPADERVTIAVTDITVREAMRRILPPLDLAHVVEGGVVIIASRERLRRRVVLELYEVGAIDVLEDDIARLVMDETHDDWCEEHGKSVQAQNGLLIVRNSRDVHARVAVLVESIRANPQPWITLIEQRRR